MAKRALVAPISPRRRAAPLIGSQGWRQRLAHWPRGGLSKIDMGLQAKNNLVSILLDSARVVNVLEVGLQIDAVIDIDVVIDLRRIFGMLDTDGAEARGILRLF